MSVWIPLETIVAEAHDYSVPGYNTTTVNNLRLWVAKASEEFNFDYFNHGDYLKAVEDKQKQRTFLKFSIQMIQQSKEKFTTQATILHGCF